MSDIKKAQEDYQKNRLRYATKSPTFAPNKPRIKHPNKLKNAPTSGVEKGGDLSE